jgi:hypothetical protein
MDEQLERKIIWQKWVNPLTGAGGDEEPKTKLEDEDEGGYKDSIETDLQVFRELREPRTYKPILGHVIAGPMGLIPVNEHGDPAVVYDFWMAHTNFDIDQAVEGIGSSVPGVESWDTFSRYRARVAFGKAFQRSEVMHAIQEALGCVPKPALKPTVDRRHETMERLKRQLASCSPYWAIFELPDGQLQTFRGSKSEVREQVKRCETLSNPPKITTSWDKP